MFTIFKPRSPGCQLRCQLPGCSDITSPHRGWARPAWPRTRALTGLGHTSRLSRNNCCGGRELRAGAVRLEQAVSGCGQLRGVWEARYWHQPSPASAATGAGCRHRDTGHLVDCGWSQRQEQRQSRVSIITEKWGHYNSPYKWGHYNSLYKWAHNYREGAWWLQAMMSPCIPSSPQSPSMAFSPPFLPRPEFGLGGLLPPSSVPGCSLPFTGNYNYCWWKDPLSSNYILLCTFKVLISFH